MQIYIVHVYVHPFNDIHIDFGMSVFNFIMGISSLQSHDHDPISGFTEFFIPCRRENNRS